MMLAHPGSNWDSSPYEGTALTFKLWANKTGSYYTSLPVLLALFGFYLYSLKPTYIR